LLDVLRARFDRSYIAMREKAAAARPHWARPWADGADVRIRRAAAWLDANEDALLTHLAGSVPAAWGR
jgi:hypothetical protein